jgi:hypothetical protein
MTQLEYEAERLALDTTKRTIADALVNPANVYKRGKIYALMCLCLTLEYGLYYAFVEEDEQQEQRVITLITTKLNPNVSII